MIVQGLISANYTVLRTNESKTLTKKKELSVKSFRELTDWFNSVIETLKSDSTVTLNFVFFERTNIGFEIAYDNTDNNPHVYFQLSDSSKVLTESEAQEAFESALTDITNHYNYSLFQNYVKKKDYKSLIKLFGTKSKYGNEYLIRTYVYNNWDAAITGYAVASTDRSSVYLYCYSQGDKTDNTKVVKLPTLFQDVKYSWEEYSGRNFVEFKKDFIWNGLVEACKTIMKRELLAGNA